MLPIAALVLQGALSTVISVDEPAMPLGKLLPIIGKQAKIELTAAPSVAKDVVLVRAKGQTLVEILNRIAEEDGAEIQKTQAGYRLARTLGAERRERARTLARQMRELEPAFAAISESLGRPVSQKIYDDLASSLLVQSRQSPNNFSLNSNPSSKEALAPGARAAMRALLAIPRDELLSLHEGDRLVYSTKPTPLQKSLPALGSVGQRFRDEQTEWATAVGRVGTLPQITNGDNPLNQSEIVDGAVTRVVAIVSRGNSRAIAGVRIVFVGKNGEDLGHGAFSLIPPSSDRAMEAWLKPSGDKVPISASTNAVIEGLPTRGQPGPAKRPSAEALNILSHPEDTDPLALGATDLLRAVAEDRPVVAVLPDRIWFVGLLVSGGVNRSQIPMLNTELDLREEKGWLVARPLDPLEARAYRVDRAVLGRFVRSFLTKGRVRLEDYADYAWNSGEAPSDILGVPIAYLIDQSGTFNPDIGWKFLRLFGSLSSFDRAELLGGKFKGWENLSERQRALVLKCGMGRSSFFGGGKGSPWLISEPTEFLSNGLGKISVTLSQKTETRVVCDATDGSAQGYQRLLGIDSIRGALDRTDGPRFDRFSAATLTSYQLGVSLVANARTNAELIDVTTLSPSGALTSLPPEILSRIKP